MKKLFSFIAIAVLLATLAFTAFASVNSPPDKATIQKQTVSVDTAQTCDIVAQFEQAEYIYKENQKEKFAVAGALAVIANQEIKSQTYSSGGEKDF